MKKIRIGANYSPTMPVVLVGTEIGGRPNYLTAGWISRVNADPPMIAVGINRANTTPDGIRENKTFSVNLPTAAMVEVTDYCGMVSGKDTDKSEIFNHFRGVLTGAPMIRDCPLTMECRLVETIEFPTHLLFIAEIVGGYADANVITGGKPDMRAIDPLLLTMPDNCYWTLGDYVGKAWAQGKYLLKKKSKNTV